jgi:polyphosphate kinase
LPARIIAKINSLAERQIIEALYRASEAGVSIDLIVRGVCCLRPGLKGLSQNITVRSIVDRFLEHSRIYYFENACQPQVFLSSADWLQRNFFRRIELAFPIEDGVLRERLIHEVLTRYLDDNVKARFLQPDGTYRRVQPRRGQAPRRSQFEFISLGVDEQKAGPDAIDGKTRFPQVKLAASPFARKTTR